MPKNTPSESTQGMKQTEKLSLQDRVKERIHALTEVQKGPYKTILEEPENGQLYRDLITADTQGALPRFRSHYNPEATPQEPWTASSTLHIALPEKIKITLEDEYNTRRQKILEQINLPDFEAALHEIKTLFANIRDNTDKKERIAQAELLREILKSLEHYSGELDDIITRLEIVCENFLGNKVRLEQLEEEERYIDQNRRFLDFGEEGDEDNFEDWNLSDNSVHAEYSSDDDENLKNKLDSDLIENLGRLEVIIREDISTIGDKKWLAKQLEEIYYLGNKKIDISGVLEWGTHSTLTFQHLTALHDSFEENNGLSEKVERAKQFNYGIKLSPKNVEDVQFGRDAGCCIAPNTDNGYSIPHYIADNGTLLFDIDQQLNGNEKTRRVGIVLAFESVDEHGTKILVCNSLELSPLMNPRVICTQVVEYVERQLGEFAKTHGYTRVEMSSHEYNTSVSYSSCSGSARNITLYKVGHDSERHIFYTDMDRSDAAMSGDFYQIFPVE